MIRVRDPRWCGAHRAGPRPGRARRPPRRGLAAPHDPPERRAALGRTTATCRRARRSSAGRPVDPIGLRAHGAQRHGVGGRRRRPRRAVRLPARRPPDLRRHRRPGRRSSTSACPAASTSRSAARPRCRHDALVNDVGLVSIVEDGVAGLRAVGRRQPRQGAVAGRPAGAVRPRAPTCSPPSRRSSTCSSRTGDFDEPAKGRMKFVVERLGPDAFRAAWQAAFDDAAARPHARRRPPSRSLDEVDRAGDPGRAPARRVERRRAARSAVPVWRR